MSRGNTRLESMVPLKPVVGWRLMAARSQPDADSFLGNSRICVRKTMVLKK